MEKRANSIRRKRYASYRTKMHLFFICGLATIILAIIIVSEHLVPKLNQASESMHSDNSVRIMAHGDLLYHLPILRGAERPDGSYDFSENFTYVKPWIEQADFAIADFEGTISPDVELAGYPLFNAPAIVANNIHDAGYDLVDLAHNHILDSHLSGLVSTVNTFRDAGVDTVGVYAEGFAESRRV